MTPHRTPKLTLEIINFTPKLAAEWLEAHANNMNRTIREKHVDELIRRMREGLWKVNGEAIIMASNGVLLDGHHRLWAAVRGEVSFKSCVITGVNPDAFDTIDGLARARSAADVIQMAGTPVNYRPIATAAGICMRYEQGTFAHKGKLVPQDVNAYFNDHPSIADFVERANRGEMRPFAAPIAAVAYLASPKYRQRALDFIDKLVSGADLPEGSPILALRNRLMNRGAVGPYARRRNDSTPERVALIIQGWNAYIDGRKLSRMQIYLGDSFPKIRGAA